MKIDDDKIYKGVEMASTLIVARIVAALLAREWTRRNSFGPPTNPRQNDVPWTTAVAWSAGVGATVGIARLLTRTAVEKRWEQRSTRA